ncbi:MAG: hypothetical protein VKN33_10980 [Candidatus Sericytochromatia bacterium]|nr:hypothetical protein [Candidatus Sericytochromatia bacterium]
MSHTPRSEAQRRIEVDEAMLRTLRSEAARLKSKLRMLEGEIAGAQQAICEKQRFIQEAAARVEELGGMLARLAEQEQKLRDDQDLWNGVVAG